MEAIILQNHGGPEQLILENVEKPIPKDDEVLVRVKATAINRTDLLSREGILGDMTGMILGVEIAGVVEAVGKNVDIPIGKKVMGLVNRGGYAQYAIMPKEHVMPIPNHLSFEQAAAIPEVFLTAYQTLFWIGQLKDRERVLIHAAASGVGTAAIQLAKHLRKEVEIFTTASSEEKLLLAKKLGASTLINYRLQSFDEIILPETNDQGVDLILDFVGATYWEKNLRSIAIDGRWVLIGILGGSIVNEMDMLQLMQKRIQLTGTLLTPRDTAYKGKLSAEFITETSSLFESKQLQPVIDTVFSLREVQLAHKHMQENKNSGKIILSVE